MLTNLFLLSLALSHADKIILWNIIWTFDFWAFALQGICIFALQVLVPGYPDFLILNIFYILSVSIDFSIFCACDCMIQFNKNTKLCIVTFVTTFFIYNRVIISNGAFPSDEVCIPLFYDCMPRIYILKTICFTMILFCLKFLKSAIFNPDCFMLIRGLIQLKTHN